MSIIRSNRTRAFCCIAFAIILVLGCEIVPTRSVPHKDRWGIYVLDLATQDVTMVYSTFREINGSVLRQDNEGRTLLFAQKIEGERNEDYEICSIGVEGTGFRRLTNNNYWDVYPAWSPDNAQIAFLSLRRTDFDIYTMNADGKNEQLLFDSGSHDADIDWSANGIVFTAKDRIWILGQDDALPRQITNPPRAGEWGNANLPFGDYDPRISPDGTQIVFERLEDDRSPNGNYNLYRINIDGSGETRLTNNGYSQGLANWDHLQRRLLYIISAINDQGIYDIYMMNIDGSDDHKVSPDYFPISFLAHSAVFSMDDSKVYFIGEWWQ